MMGKRLHGPASPDPEHLAPAKPRAGGSNRDVLVLVPGSLKVTVANALLDKANEHGPGSETYKGLYALAAQVDTAVAVGRNDRETIYDQIAKSTGVPRDKVKEVVHAFQYSG